MFASKTKAVLAVCAVAALATLGGSRAGASPSPLSQTLNISATIGGSCTFNAPSAVALTYDPLANAPTQKVSSFTYQCSANTALPVFTVDGGKNAGKSSSGKRALAGAQESGQYLGYQLQALSGTTSSCPASPTDLAIGGTFNGKADGTVQTQYLCVSAPAAQTTANGTDYSDMVTITFTFQ